MNIYSGEIPGLLSSIIGNQTINLRIENEEARDKEVGVKIEGAAVREMQMGGYPNATLRVETSVSQINEITTSDQPLQELNSALENGGIEYESNGAFNSLRMSFATQLLSVAAAM